MTENTPTFFTKLVSNLPWLVRYPFVRTENLFKSNSTGKKHIIFIIANHFEPSWSENGNLNLDEQNRRLDDYYKIASKTGELIRDKDGTKFRHTNFFPVEQYHHSLLEKLSQMQAEGLGETEIHLHHGVEKPDTSENLRKILIEYRDIFAEEHKLLSRSDGDKIPRWAFVHGNLALGNSCNGKYCGVDDELQILAETGCYADFTYPTAPDETQVPIINKIYECGLPLNQSVPHRIGKPLKAGEKINTLPIIVQGPLVLNWKRTIKGIPVPKIDDGALVYNQRRDMERFNRWTNANVTIEGKDDWIFVKLYCHGFFTHDQSACIGEEAQRFFGEIIENSERTGEFDIYFATAREVFNMISAATDGKKGSPDEYRNYSLKAIMEEPSELKIKN
jgi:hypothetical protein